MPVSGFQQHDHSYCIQDALAIAERRCKAEKLQFTSIRRRVLEILLSEHKALGAYAILQKLDSEGRKAQPPVAYRALDFLVRNGFAHKVEQLNAYVACTHPALPHAPAFMICRACDAVAEACLSTGDQPLTGVFAGSASAAGFRIETAVVEASGLCPTCQIAPHAPDHC